MTGKPNLYAIVGMKHRGTEALVASLTAADEITLVREPSNRFDPNAIQVWARGKHVGYIPKTQNAVLAKFIDDHGKTVAIMGMDEGGGNVESARGKSLDAKLHVGHNEYPLIELK